MSCYEIVFLIITKTHYRPKKYPYTIRAITSNVCKYSKRRRLNKFIMVGLIKHESNFTRRAKSGTEDYGVMQIHSSTGRFGTGPIPSYKCDLFNLRCNINKGTRYLYLIRKACKKHKHGFHWLRHYNWRKKKHYLRVLWLAEAYRRAFNGQKLLYNIIKNRKYMKLNIDRYCIKSEDLCGAF